MKTVSVTILTVNGVGFVKAFHVLGIISTWDTQTDGLQFKTLLSITMAFVFKWEAGCVSNLCQFQYYTSPILAEYQ